MCLLLLLLAAVTDTVKSTTRRDYSCFNIYIIFIVPFNSADRNCVTIEWKKYNENKSLPIHDTTPILQKDWNLKSRFLRPRINWADNYIESNMVPAIELLRRYRQDTGETEICCRFGDLEEIKNVTATRKTGGYITLWPNAHFLMEAGTKLEYWSVSQVNSWKIRYRYLKQYHRMFGIR